MNKPTQKGLDAALAGAPKTMTKKGGKRRRASMFGLPG